MRLSCVLRVPRVLIPILALSMLPASANAMGLGDLPPALPALMLPGAVPDLDRLPDLPNLGDLIPTLPSPGGPQGGPPDLGVPIGPPSPFPAALPPHANFEFPANFPTIPVKGTQPVPEPGTGLLTMLGLGLLAARRRSHVRA